MSDEPPFDPDTPDPDVVGPRDDDLFDPPAGRSYSDAGSNQTADGFERENGGNGSSAYHMDEPPIGSFSHSGREVSFPLGGVPASEARREPPYNIDAEQALLGAILINNEALYRVADLLRPEHFYDPLHQRLYGLLNDMIHRGQLAEPRTVQSYFANDPAMAEIGGTGYLAKLAVAAPTIIYVPEYARLIFELYQRRGLMTIGQDMAATAFDMSLEKPPSEQIQDAEQRLYGLAEAGTYEGGFIDFGAAARQAVETANEAVQREGGLSGITSGFIDLDRQLGGLHPSDLLILAGRPSMGKTSLATNIAFNAAKAYVPGQNPDGSRKAAKGGIVAFYSLEMSAEQLATRLLSEESRIPSNRIRKGDVSEDEFRRFVEAQRELQSLPLYIDDTGGLSIAALTARARRLQRQHGLDLIVVDYLQLVTTAGSKGSDNRVQEVSQVTQGLKALAKELHVPVIALSQLSRKVEERDDKRPQLSDLRESGSIEQDADVVMFVFREEYYVERTKPPDSDVNRMVEWMDRMEKVHGLAELIIGKQRHGPTGTIELAFQADITRFGNKAKVDYPDDGRY